MAPKPRTLELWTDRGGAGVQSAWLRLKAGPMCAIALKHSQEYVQSTLVILTEGTHGEWLRLASEVSGAVTTDSLVDSNQAMVRHRKV